MDKINRNDNRLFTKSKTDKGLKPRIHKDSYKTRKRQ